MILGSRRVVPALGRHVGWRFAMLGASLGGLWGLVASSPRSGMSLVSMLPSGLPQVLAILGVGMVSLGGMIFIPSLLRATQRWGALIGLAIGYAVMVVPVTELGEALSRGDGGADVAAWWKPSSVLWVVVIGVASIGWWAVLRTLTRLFLVQAHEHVAGNCSWCGYVLGSDRIQVCPECGRPAGAATPPTFRAHRVVMSVVWLQRHAGLVLTGVLVLLIALAQWPLWQRTIPSSRFYSRFPDAVRLAPYPHSRTSRDIGEPRVCVWVARSVGSAEGVYITRFLGRSSGSTQRKGMEFSEGGRPVWSQGTHVQSGSTLITAVLDEPQALWVVGHGLPPQLAAAIYARAGQRARDPIAPALEPRVEVLPEWFRP